MPAMIVRQPNGKLARWSSVVDAFTHGHMTEAEAIELCREEMGRRDAEEKVQRGVEDRDPWTDRPSTHPQKLGRWESCMEDMVLNRDIEDAVKLLRQLGDWPKWETYMREYASENGCNADTSG